MTSQPNAPEPLAEASPLSLDDLFALDPLKLSSQNRASIVEELRRQRKNWSEAEAQGKRAPAAKKAPKPSLKLDEVMGLSLDDLGL